MGLGTGSKAVVKDISEFFEVPHGDEEWLKWPQFLRKFVRKLFMLKPEVLGYQL